jgi:hypothetical protein
MRIIKVEYCAHCPYINGIKHMGSATCSITGTVIEKMLEVHDRCPLETMPTKQISTQRTQ